MEDRIPTYLIIIDNLRYDQWKIIEPIIIKDFDNMSDGNDVNNEIGGKAEDWANGLLKDMSNEKAVFWDGFFYWSKFWLLN